MYNIMGGARITEQDFSNLFWAGHQLSLGELAVWFGHFANLVSADQMEAHVLVESSPALHTSSYSLPLLYLQGYAIVSRENNEWSNCCAEFTMVRVEQPVGCSPIP